MRISKEKRRENIKSVFRAVIQLSKDAPFDSLTMKAIAKEAGIGEATIYNYFPKKDALITGFLEWSVEEAIAQTLSETTVEMSFTDVFHTLLENHMEVLTPAKHFFAESVQALFVNPISLANTSVAKTRLRHIEFTQKSFDTGVANGEFPAPPFQNFLVSLLWDYHVGVLYYWLKEDSPSSLRTTQLIDLSMKVLEELLRSDLFSKVYAVAHFLFKEHILHQLLNPKGISFEK